MIPSNTDKFGSILQQGDVIIVCYDRNGYLSKATITGEKGNQWVIDIEIYPGQRPYSKRIDKNPRRIVKHG